MCVTSHQRKYSCATPLLNAGACILTLQAMLGHGHVDTTLGYARLYDGTVAEHYYCAMGQVEERLESVKNLGASGVIDGQLLPTVDMLCAGVPEFV
jgi:hypothetical protein